MERRESKEKKNPKIYQSFDYDIINIIKKYRQKKSNNTKKKKLSMMIRVGHTYLSKMESNSFIFYNNYDLFSLSLMVVACGHGASFFTYPGKTIAM